MANSHPYISGAGNVTAIIPRQVRARPHTPRLEGIDLMATCGHESTATVPAHLDTDLCGASKATAGHTPISPARPAHTPPERRVLLLRHASVRAVLGSRCGRYNWRGEPVRSGVVESLRTPDVQRRHSSDRRDRESNIAPLCRWLPIARSKGDQINRITRHATPHPWRWVLRSKNGRASRQLPRSISASSLSRRSRPIAEPRLCGKASSANPSPMENQPRARATAWIGLAVAIGARAMAVVAAAIYRHGTPQLKSFVACASTKKARPSTTSAAWRALHGKYGTGQNLAKRLPGCGRGHARAAAAHATACVAIPNPPTRRGRLSTGDRPFS